MPVHRPPTQFEELQQKYAEKRPSAEEMFSGPQSQPQTIGDHPLDKFAADWSQFITQMEKGTIEDPETSWVNSREQVFFSAIPSYLKAAQDKVRNSPTHNFTNAQIRDGEMALQGAPLDDPVALEDWWEYASDSARYQLQQAGYNPDLTRFPVGDDRRTSMQRLRRKIIETSFSPAKEKAHEELVSLTDKIEKLYRILQRGDSLFDGKPGVLTKIRPLKRPNPLAWESASFDSEKGWMFG